MMQKKVINRLEIKVFCKPKNKPTKTYIVNSAGAENILIEI